MTMPVIPCLRFAALAVGAALHAAVLLLPLCFGGRSFENLHDGALGLFLALMTLFFLAESRGSAMAELKVTRAGESASSTAPLASADRIHTRLAALTGGLILAVLWIAVGERTCQGSTGFASPGPSALGAALMLGGIALRYAAIRSLGRYFGNRITILPDQSLVRTGIYRWLRHPSETGLLAIVLGTCLLLGSPVAATIGCLVLLPVVLWRIAGEDRQLAAAYAEEFAAYRRDVAGLVPFLV